jgi:TetR/AcrR family transcriptional repressor for divergent bdcA
MTAKKICGTRGRPRGFCADQAVERAMMLFASRGYEGVGVAELSQALGVNPPSLYAAFGSKRGLFERALQLYAQRFGGDLPAALESSGDLGEAVGRLFAVAADLYTRDSEAKGCMVMEGAGSGETEACPLLQEAQQGLKCLVLERIRRDMVAEPELLADYCGRRAARPVRLRPARREQGAPPGNRRHCGARLCGPAGRARRGGRRAIAGLTRRPFLNGGHGTTRNVVRTSRATVATVAMRPGPQKNRTYASVSMLSDIPTGLCDAMRAFALQKRCLGAALESDGAVWECVIAEQGQGRSPSDELTPEALP